MTGYTRQSIASIINGSNITAPPLNAEFDQLLAAFNASTDTVTMERLQEQVLK